MKRRLSALKTIGAGKRVTLLYAILYAIVLVTTMAIVARHWKARQCDRRGHLWIEDETGFHCRRCPRRMNIGDRL